MQIREIVETVAYPAMRVEARTGCELLVELSAASDGSLEDVPPEALAALDAVGDSSGELWLHLLGLALEAPEPGDARAVIDHVAATDPIELRRHLLGVHVPKWHAYVRPSDLEAAARGDREAGERLLEAGGYYAGRARDALETILHLDGEETASRILAALRTWNEQVFSSHEAERRKTLANDVAAKRGVLESRPLPDAIEEITGGYVYEPEPEIREVRLVPHIAHKPWLLLCQHDDIRLICYPADDETPDREHVLAIGRAIGDDQRLRILELLGEAELTLADLATSLDLAKSTVHHHVGILRASGLVGVVGNARQYRYRLRRSALERVGPLLTSHLLQEGTP